jgi:chemotaxis methyl-accepting protein methylase
MSGPMPVASQPGSVSGPVQVATRLLVERTGMRVTEGLKERLAAYLDGAARASGRTPEGYAAGLAGDPGAFQELLDCVTVQESGFFRHPDQFTALAREVLPSLEGPVVVWSAGCANGQEAYSLAMELAASGRPDWEVLATDISAAAVARARAGRYSTAELAGLPPVHRHWLRPAGDLWEVDPALRRRVRVGQADLTTRFPAPPGRCQVVFCRNVLIYLTREVTESFLDRLSSWLTPGGLVFLGYSETMLAPTDRLRLDRVGDTHALRVVPPGSGRLQGSGGLVGSGGLEGSGGLWTTPDAPAPGRLRSPTGGPGAEPAGWSASGRPAAVLGGPGSGATPAPGSGATPAPGSVTPAPGSGGVGDAAADMIEAGVVAAAGGDPRGAVAAFRRAVFLEPDRPAAWFQLGLALEAVAGRQGARRAYAAALAALERCDQGAVEAELDGWRTGELAGVLRAKLGRTGGGDRP